MAYLIWGRIAAAYACVPWSRKPQRTGDRHSCLAALRADHPQAVAGTGETATSSLRILFQWPLVLAAALMSFAHGANDFSNAIGPVVAIVRALHDEAVSTSARAPLWVMLVGAFGLSCGILLYGPRLIRLVGEQITKLNPMRAFCVFGCDRADRPRCIALRPPVSTTHTAIGAVFGVSASSASGTRNRHGGGRSWSRRSQPANPPGS